MVALAQAAGATAPASRCAARGGKNQSRERWRRRMRRRRGGGGGGGQQADHGFVLLDEGGRWGPPASRLLPLTCQPSSLRGFRFGFHWDPRLSFSFSFLFLFFVCSAGCACNATRTGGGVQLL